jgi:phosphoglycerate kinase
MALVDEKIGAPVASVFVEEVENIEIIDAAVDSAQIVFLENIRFFEGEKNNDPAFLQYLASLAEVYVQEAFAVAHRTSPSMMVGSVLPCYFGNSFIKEYRALEEVVNNPKKPVVVVLGGAKADKLDHIETLQYIADRILLVGTLPREVNFAKINEKVIIGILRSDGMDIDDDTIAKFCEIVKSAGTVIWAGSAGKWEDPECEKGTKSLLEAMALSGAFSIIAGGDTTAACRRFGYGEKVGLISSGGGVMMEFLAKKCLPVVETARII